MVRIKLMLGLAVLVVMAAGTSVAQAQNPNNDTVVTTFDGATTNLGDNNCANPATDDCGVPIAEGAACTANDGIDDPTTDDGDLNEFGCYHFTGNVPANPPGAGCVFLDPTDTGVPSENNTACSGTIVSTGNYQNITCGTGTATGWATITTGIPGDDLIEIDYTITFVAGQGVMTINGDGQDGHTDGAGPGITGGGVVSILPTTTPPGPPPIGCVNAPATGFTVKGSTTMVLPDNGPH
jgi:hypothetical protein